MKAKRVLCIPLLLLAISGREARAFIDIDESFAPVFAKSGDGGLTTGNPVPVSGLGYDSRTTAAIRLFGHFLIGAGLGLYSSPGHSSDKTADGSQSLQQFSTSRTEYGPSLGLQLGGFHALFTYLYKGSRTISEKDLNSDGSVAIDAQKSDSLAWGYWLDLGYTFHVSHRLGIGPSLVYRSSTYKSTSFTDNLDPSQNFSSDYLTRPVEGALSAMITLRFAL